MPSKAYVFLKEEGGAVTVDWVVLTAALIGIALAVLIPIAYSTDNLAERVGFIIGNVEVAPDLFEE